MHWRNDILLRFAVNTDMNIRVLAGNVLTSRTISQKGFQFIARYKICTLSLSVALIGQNILQPSYFSSFQSLHHPRDPNSVILKMEAAHSSGMKEKDPLPTRCSNTEHYHLDTELVATKQQDHFVRFVQFMAEKCFKPNGTCTAV